MRITLGAVVVALLALVGASAATADHWDPSDYYGSAPPPTKAADPDPTGVMMAVGDGPAGTTEPQSQRPLREGRRCKTMRGMRTCTYYRNSRAYRVCYKRPGRKESCRRLGTRGFALIGKSGHAASVVELGGRAWERPSRSATQRAQRDARRAFGRAQRELQGLRDHGYTRQLLRPVGRLHEDSIGSATSGFCSGTLVARGVVLTAAHCLYENGLMSNAPRGYGVLSDLWFYPGQTWLDGYGYADARDGKWQAKRWWVTGAWSSGDSGRDWGLIELYPNANGQYPGDFTGSFEALGNITYNVGAHAYAVGYPASGIFAAYPFGNGQYFCDINWDGHAVDHGSNVLLYHQCAFMTGGASGGAVFIELSDGRWVIGGVINQGWPNKVTPSYMATNYFDGGIVEFWNSVAAIINSG